MVEGQKVSAIAMNHIKIYPNPNGRKEYYSNDLLHREDGPAIEYNDGSKEYWINGIQHREDGPAVEHETGTKEYWIVGKLHREDGPAIEYSDGDIEYYLCGKEYSYEEWLRLRKLIVFL